MTKAEIVTEILARLNLTSTEAAARVERIVDRYYKKVTAKIGIAPMTRIVLDSEAQTDIGTAEVTFTDMEKVSRVWYYAEDDADQSDKIFLDERTVDELRDVSVPPEGDTPTRYAVLNSGATETTILLDQIPESVFDVFCDGYGTSTALDDDEEPAFPESFHDILVEGPLKDEYKKRNNVDAARDSRNEYEELLSDLRMWGAKNKALKIQQGGRPRFQTRRYPH